MEVLAIFYKLSKEADFISKLKNGQMWLAKLMRESQVAANASERYFLSLYSSRSPFGADVSPG